MNEILPAISVFIKRQTNLKVLKTWVGDISAEADFDEYAKAFTPKMMAGLKTLSIGFNRYNYKNNYFLIVLKKNLKLETKAFY